MASMKTGTWTQRTAFTQIDNANVKQTNILKIRLLDYNILLVVIYSLNWDYRSRNNVRSLVLAIYRLKTERNLDAKCQAVFHNERQVVAKSATCDDLTTHAILIWVWIHFK